MKRNLITTVILICVGFISVAQQPQQHRWFLPDKAIDFSTGTLTAHTLPGNGIGGSGSDVSNGVHDDNGDLLFYIKRGHVVNKYGDDLGLLFNTAIIEPEIVIAPIRLHSCRFYVIYTELEAASEGMFDCPAVNGIDKQNTYYSIVDMSMNDGAGGILVHHEAVDICTQGFNASMAVAYPSLSLQYLYRAHATPSNIVVTRFTMTPTGISNPLLIKSIPVTLPFFTTQMNLSFNEDKLIMANAESPFTTTDVLVIHLNGNGELDAFAGNNSDGTSTYDIMGGNAGFYAGAEFSPNGLYAYIAHTTLGIYQLDLATGSSNQILGTTDYGKSQLEVGFEATGDNKIYAANANSLGAIGKPDLSFVNLTFTTNILQNEIVPAFDFNTLVRLLPDQIDGYDYLTHLSPIVQACCETYAYDALSFTSTGTGSATWTPTSNPFSNQTVVGIRDKLVIPSGKTVLVQNMEFRFGEDATVEILPNAKLILDNSKFTAIDCEDFRWEGIYVSGNSTASQSQNPGLFGRVEILNGSVIEYADGALNNFGLNANGEVDWNSIGGIIQAENSTFKNNWRTGQFLAYQNTSSAGLPIDDKSFFRECDFIYDDDALNGSHLYAHISQWATDGVNIHGCNFSNTQTADETDKGTGILSIGAEYIVRDQCTGSTYPCPPSQQIHNTFSGLYYGIHASGYGNGNAITSVSNTTFSNNAHGIYAGSLDELNVHDNTFKVNGQSGPVGIYLEQTPNTDIFQNAFETDDIATFPSGITAKNLGHKANAIYNNSFEGLFVGSGALGNNKLNSFGLEFLCNDYTGNFVGIAANVHNPQIGAQGIAKDQGGKLDAAGNTFNHNTWYDIYNAAENVVYWHHSVQSTSDPLYPSLVTTATVTRADAAVTYANDDCSIDGGSIDKMAKYNDKTSEMELKESELEAIKDGGDTEGTMTSVALTGVGEEYELRNELLQKSPNVSEEVLKATIEKPAPFPNAMLRDVLAANPQAGKDKEVMEAIEMLAQPMTEEMKAQIEVAAQNVSPKEAKESEVALEGKEREKLTQEIAVELLNDETQYDPEAAKTFLETKDDLSADLELVKVYTKEKDVAGIDESLDRIESREGDKEYVEAKFDEFEAFMNLQKQLITEGKEWLQADANTINELWNISSSESQAGQYAQNILEFMGLNEFEKERIVVSPPAPSSKMASTKRVATQGWVKVKPNPVRDYLILSYDLSHLGEGAVFEIIGATGKPIVSTVLQSTTDEIVVDLKTVKAGTYAYRVLFDGKLQYSGKVVVAD